MSRGLTEYVADEFTFKLQLLNCNVVSLKDPNIMKIKTKGMKKNEMAFIFSLNGETEELVKSAKNAQESGKRELTSNSFIAICECLYAINDKSVYCSIDAILLQQHVTTHAPLSCA